MQRRIYLIAIFFLGSLLSGSPSFAEGDRFQPDLVQIKDDIYVFIRNPSVRYPVLSNVVVIINENDVVVVDGGTPSHVENVVKGIKSLTDKPVSMVITTHWHQDHYYGNGVYRKYYPDVKFITHENTAITLLNRSEDLADTLNQLSSPETLEAINQQIDGVIQKMEDEGKPEMAEYFRDYKLGFPEVGADLLIAENVPFDETFSEKKVIKREKRTIELLYLGLANTNGDTFIYLPDDKILITGDTVVWPTPYGFFSYPKEWSKTLRKALELDFDVLIPGHGTVQNDTTYVENLISLFESITEQTQKAVDGGAQSLEEVREAVDFSEFDTLIAKDDPLLVNRFNSWFKNPILESTFAEATGEKVNQYNPEEDPFEPKPEPSEETGNE